MELTALNEEGVGLPPLDGDLRYELVVDPPGDAPGRVTGDGRVASLAPRRPDARRQRVLVVDGLDGPRRQCVLVVGRVQRVGALVVVPAREVDTDVVCKSKSLL